MVILVIAGYHWFSMVIPVGFMVITVFGYYYWFSIVIPVVFYGYHGYRYVVIISFLW